MSGTRMTTLTFILSELFPLDGFRCNFTSAPYLECLWYIIIILYSYDKLGNVSHTRMTTLTFILPELPSLMVKATVPSSLNTIRNISMTLYGSIEEVLTVCCV